MTSGTQQAGFPAPARTDMDVGQMESVAIEPKGPMVEFVKEDDCMSAIAIRREVLPETRLSKTHKFMIGGHEGYLTVGLFPDGRPGEIFIKMSKEGSTLSGLIQGFCRAFSLALQHGLTVRDASDRFRGMQGSVRDVGGVGGDGLREVYVRPPQAFLQPASLMAVLRKRLGPLA